MTGCDTAVRKEDHDVVPFLVMLCLGLCAPLTLVAEPALTPQDSNQGGAVKLTRPDGTPIYVNPHAIAFIRGPLPGEQGHTTVVFSNGAKQTVQESVQDIMKIWEAERLPPPETPP
jgi:uncharacterized protein YlzI (FlbEa/FlbD family)